MAMTHLYLIRHGQALTNVDGIMNDYGLTPLGVKQAEHLRDRLAETSEIVPDVLIASTLPRAKQTAEIIAPALGLPIILDDEVQELRPGEGTGMHIDEYQEKYARYSLYDDPFLKIPPGAENWGQFVLRVSTAIHRIIKQYEGKTIVIVCHGGVIDTTFTYFLGLDSLHLPQVIFHTRNTAITYWRKIVEDARYQSIRWRLMRYNDDFHLRALETSTRIYWQGIDRRQRVEKAR
jgi:2,3-bisphosphoglycerate-dependent phosphoglycerate mutase